MTETDTLDRTITYDAKENADDQELKGTDARILPYDDLGLPDFDMEIDLTDIFGEEKEGIRDDEVLKIFSKGGSGKKNGNVSDRTMVADRASIKEGVLEDNSLEKQQERKSREEEELREELGDIDRKKKKHRHSHFFLKLVLLVLAAAAVVAFALSPLFTIKHIKVEGNKFYTDEQIINMSEAKAEGNLFLNAQKGPIKRKLKDDIYFRSVNVRRSIPDTLVIEVVEKEEIAGLVYGDRFIVIDDRGEVLRIAKLDPEVTTVVGLTIKKMDIGEKLEVEETRVLNNTMKALHNMKDGDIFFKRIEVSKTSMTAYIYDMMKVQGTSEQLKNSIDDGSLRKVVNKLMKEKIKRGTIILGDNGYISFSPAV